MQAANTHRFSEYAKNEQKIIKQNLIAYIAACSMSARATVKCVVISAPE